uniref:Odorant-binding protein 15 n=1 Tax=Encarsia formosa TaxID=32400 RepID=A0A514TTX4_ENCFO|nr:odorant-binding protein 15 [Encarsia formosa]
MKNIFLAFSVLLVVAQIHGNTEADFWDQCKDELGITEDIFEDLDLEDPKIKCLFACAMRKMGVIVDGKVQYNVEMDYPISEYTGQHITDCINKANKENNECDMAVTLYTCIVG